MIKLAKAKKASLFLNGEIEDIDQIKSKFDKENYDIVIGVDGGANHLQRIGAVPDYIVGDLDSIDKESLTFFIEKGTEFKKYPSKKNETDTELAIWLARDLGAQSIDLYGALGGRIDHEIANIHLLYYIIKRGLNPRILDKNRDLYIVGKDPLEISGKAGDLISLIPLYGDAKGVTLGGLEYPLEKYDMEFSKPRGISNVMIGQKCSISLEEGYLLVMKNEL